MLQLFWIKFEGTAFKDLPGGTTAGVGVTALDEKDALRLVENKFFSVGQLPVGTTIDVISDVDSLDQNHVRPNMGNHLRRGIWYPLLTTSWSS